MLLIGSFEPQKKQILYSVYESYISCLSKSRIGPSLSHVMDF